MATETSWFPAANVSATLACYLSVQHSQMCSGENDGKVDLCVGGALRFKVALMVGYWCVCSFFVFSSFEELKIPFFS